jgi:hypothetical protein
MLTINLLRKIHFQYIHSFLSLRDPNEGTSLLMLLYELTYQKKKMILYELYIMVLQKRTKEKTLKAKNKDHFIQAAIRQSFCGNFFYFRPFSLCRVIKDG